MSTPLSAAAARRLPCVSRADGCSGQRATTTTTSVQRLLADIAYQWQKERRQRVAGRHGQRRRCDGQMDVMTTSLTETEKRDADDDGDSNREAASAYWWTDVFLRYFVFDDEDDDDDSAKSAVAADTDDLLFFVRRRRRGRRNDKRRLPTAQQRRRRITYETRAYRKQQHRRSQQQQQPTLLPIGDPAVLWRHTVCLNTIVHRLRYTLTVAVCVHVPRKSATAGTERCGWDDQQDAAEDFVLDEEPDDRDEYDLQLLSRYVHTVYASTSCRRMDAAKGPRERPVYPAVCWAVDDYAEAFRTVIVHPGQTVCAELVAAWPGPSVVEERDSADEDGGEERDDLNTSCRRNTAISVRQNRAVLFAAAVPYAAVRATYECKMSLYREAERQRRKRHKPGKKSSLGAALSASLTALFTSTKSSSGGARSQDNGDDPDYYYGMASSDADRIEYVTVRGCFPECDVGWSSDNEDVNLDDSVNSDAYNNTKGLGQMAVTLAPVQPSDPLTPSRHEHRAQQQHCYGGADCGRDECYNGDCSYDYSGCCGGVGDDDDDDDDEYRQQLQLQRPLAIESPYSEPGDFYDYGWEYETAASSGHQTPQTPTRDYHRRQQQCLDRRRRRRRLSDPCSTSVYELLYGSLRPNRQPTTGQLEWCAAGGRRRRHERRRHGQHRSAGGHGFGTPETPVQLMANRLPHRAWSESDGLDRCGGGGGGGGFGQPQKPVLLPPPPPPVPYYCAAEAAASGFAQFVRKSPGGWWAREKTRRLTERGRRRRRRQTATSRRRSASAGGNGSGGCCGPATDDDDDGGGGGGGGSDGGCSDSDGEADSDGEFVGALAAAAAVGHDPDREWDRLGAAGDPVADWERSGGRSDSADSAAEESATGREAADGADAVEWTTEIVAADLRRSGPVRNEPIVTAPTRTTTALDPSWWCGGLSPAPSASVTANHQLQQQQFSQSPQKRHRRPPPPQFRPQPAEPPPPPPALSVSFTAVACPWWTILEDVLLVTSATTSSGAPLSTSAPGFPLLTFD